MVNNLVVEWSAFWIDTNRSSSIVSLIEGRGEDMRSTIPWYFHSFLLTWRWWCHILWMDCKTCLAVALIWFQVELSSAFLLSSLYCCEPRYHYCRWQKHYSVYSTAILGAFIVSIWAKTMIWCGSSSCHNVWVVEGMGMLLSPIKAFLNTASFLGI